ncbi:MAG: mechanosensitive ion channel [Myxococcota bacterium]|nr:mechanosensitive ion channel [Myxococcota bacterium]
MTLTLLLSLSLARADNPAVVVQEDRSVVAEPVAEPSLTESPVAEPPLEPALADPIHVSIEMPPQVPATVGLLPSVDLPMRGTWSALPLLVLTGILMLISTSIKRLRDLLRPAGLMPAALLALSRAASTAATFALIGAIIALVPPTYAPVLPWMFLAAAVAFGWSARDVLPDLIGGLVIRIDGRVTVGQRLVGAAEPGRGVVSDLGLLSVTLTDGDATWTVPNRRLLKAPLRVEDTRCPEVAVWLTLPADVPPAVMRAALSEAALTTPWGAPGVRPELQQDPASPARWRVVMRVLHESAIEDFQGSLRERVLEHLAAD